MKHTLIVGALALAISGGAATAGDLYLTGHDVLLHGGQVGYDGVILDYLRGADAKAGYTVAVVGSGEGFASFTGGANFTGSASGSAIPLAGTLAGYGSATYYQTGTGADWSTILAADALVILSHTSCGGCDLSTAGADEVEANAGSIATAFNAGMDIWGISGASDSTYYNFLPAGAAASGASIGGSSGFVATPEGAGIGILATQINGYPTHNKFTSYDSDFTVMETRPLSTGETEVISLALRGGTIDDGGGISTPDGGTTATALALSLLGMMGFRFQSRRS